MSRTPLRNNRDEDPGPQPRSKPLKTYVYPWVRDNPGDW